MPTGKSARRVSVPRDRPSVLLVHGRPRCRRAGVAMAVIMTSVLMTMVDTTIVVLPDTAVRAETEEMT